MSLATRRCICAARIEHFPGFRNSSNNNDSCFVLFKGMGLRQSRLFPKERPSVTKQSKVGGGPGSGAGGGSSGSAIKDQLRCGSDYRALSQIHAPDGSAVRRAFNLSGLLMSPLQHYLKEARGWRFFSSIRRLFVPLFGLIRLVPLSRESWTRLIDAVAAPFLRERERTDIAS